MARRGHPLTVGCRVTEREQARIDAAARIRGLSRAEYVRAVVLPRAADDLREAAGPSAEQDQ